MVEKFLTIMNMRNQRWQMRKDHPTIPPLTRNDIVGLYPFRLKLHLRG